MKHYVFCGAEGELKNSIYICAALKTAEILDMQFDLENDVAQCPYHSKIVQDENPDDLNLEIYFENECAIQLIDDCMQWARVYDRQLTIQKSLIDKTR